MPTNDFKDRVKSALSTGHPDPAFSEAVEAIRQAAQGIEESGLVSGGSVRVEPGHLLNLGQQLNVVLSVPASGFREVLFRAYIPDSGFPVSLDFFGEEPVVCEDLQELQTQLLRLLQDRNVSARLRMIVPTP